MRGLGAFQRAQMRDTDPRVNEFFIHVRRAVDVLEQMMLRPHRVALAEIERKAPDEHLAHSSPSIPAAAEKLAYSIKEIRQLVSVGHTTIYRAIGSGELRAVKFGHKTLILAKDLQDWLGKMPAIR